MLSKRESMSDSQVFKFVVLKRQKMKGGQLKETFWSNFSMKYSKGLCK